MQHLTILLTCLPKMVAIYQRHPGYRVYFPASHVLAVWQMRICLTVSEGVTSLALATWDWYAVHSGHDEKWHL